MSKKRTDNDPTGFSPNAQEPTSPTTSGSANAEADVAAGQAAAARSDDPTAGPDCPYCHVPSKLTSTQSIFRYYACPTPACPFRTKVVRPEARRIMRRQQAQEPIIPDQRP